MTPPEEFTGEAEKARDFVHQCEMYFRAKASKFPTDESKIRYFDSRMKDEGKKYPRRWATMRERIYLLSGFPTWDKHKADFLDTYQSPDPRAEAMSRLHAITQGDRSVHEFNVEFNTLLAEAGVINPDADESMAQQYVRALDHKLVDKLLLVVPDHAPLSLWQNHALIIDNRRRIVKSIRQRKDHTHYSNHSTTSNSNTTSTPDPNAMEIDAITTRKTGVKCYNCRREGHIARECRAPRRNQEQNEQGNGRGQGRNNSGRGGFTRQFTSNRGNSRTQIRATQVEGKDETNEGTSNTNQVDINAVMALSMQQFDELATRYYSTRSKTNDNETTETQKDF
jgi:hypothetical protein